MNERHLNAQVGVLGCVLIDETLVGKVIHRTREEDFTGPYRTVYQAVKAIFLTGKPVDLITLSAKLGPDYDSLLLQIMELTPTAANVDAYLDELLDAARLDRLREAGASLQNCKTLDDALAVVARINRSVGDRPSVRVVSMTQGFQDFYDRQQTVPEFLPWGIGKLDSVVMAERSGDFLVIGGYPSAGKTALSVQFAWNQAEKLKIGYFSLETKPEKLIDRTVPLVTGLDFGKIKRHHLDQADWQVCKQHATALTERNLWMIQAGGLSVADIQALALAGRYDIIYVDYLQLIRAGNPRLSEFEKVTQISMDLHTMAQTTGITVVALSQLTRPEKGGKEQERAPGLHSLRQSGQIEQDADAVMLLYKENSKDPASRRCLKIAKNKEGEVGGILMLDFDGKHQRFTVADQTADIASELSRRGRAAKAASHARQTSLFQELRGPDLDSPWPDAPPAEGG